MNQLQHVLYISWIEVCFLFFAYIGNCSEEHTSQLTWPSTESGQTVTQLCFPNTTSINLTATRTCDNDENWMAPNTSDCTNGKVHLSHLPAYIK